MSKQEVSRRTLLKDAGTALAGLTVLQVAGPAQAFPQDGQGRNGEPDASLALQQVGDEVIPWLDQPAPNPIPANVGNLLKWEELDSWRTPTDNFFFVNHYGQPDGLDEATWRVGIAGLVRRPPVPDAGRHQGARAPRGGLHIGVLGQQRHRIGLLHRRRSAMPAGEARGWPRCWRRRVSWSEGTEVVFWGADRGTVTIRDNSGIVSGGKTGAVEPDADGGLDLTITEQFARSMSLDEALDRDNLLCYEMNGEPLPPEHGFPVRLIAPGWYGVANVKWLTRIEVMDHRYAGRFMARDYVSIREEQRDGETVWTFTTVSHDRLKSAPAKVTRRGNRYTIMGAAWGAPIAAVEVRIDDGPWMPATLVWPSAAPGKIARLRLEVLDVRLGEPGAGRARDHVAGVRHRRQHPASAGRPVPRQQEDLLGEQRAHHPSGADSLTVRLV